MSKIIYEIDMCGNCGAEDIFMVVSPWGDSNSPELFYNSSIDTLSMSM